MANTVETLRTWSFLSFAREHDSRVALANCTNSETGEQFKALAFGADRDTRVFCSFGRSVGELTPQELAAQKDELNVVKWKTDEGKEGYTLCKPGNSDNWQDVSNLLGL